MPAPDGLPTPAEMASKLFGYSDPEENKAWSKQFDHFRETQDDREKSGFVDSVQMASSMAVGAIPHLKSVGESITVLGEETGLFPGHVAQSESRHGQQPEESVQKSPEDEFSDKLVSRITSNFKERDDAAPKGPRLLGENFGR